MKRSGYCDAGVVGLRRGLLCDLRRFSSPLLSSHILCAIMQLILLEVTRHSSITEKESSMTLQETI